MYISQGSHFDDSSKCKPRRMKVFIYRTSLKVFIRHSLYCDECIYQAKFAPWWKRASVMIQTLMYPSGTDRTLMKECILHGTRIDRLVESVYQALFQPRWKRASTTVPTGMKACISHGSHLACINKLMWYIAKGTDDAIKHHVIVPRWPKQKQTTDWPTDWPNDKATFRDWTRTNVHPRNKWRTSETRHKPRQTRKEY